MSEFSIMNVKMWNMMCMIVLFICFCGCFLLERSFLCLWMLCSVLVGVVVLVDVVNNLRMENFVMKIMV